MSSSYCIALADDEPDVRSFLRDCLTRAGHKVVIEAESGEELIQLTGAISPDLIITDVKMNKIDGLEAVNLILREKEVPVIVLTAYHGDDFINRANACHALAYLIKPVREQDILAAVPLAIERFQEMRSLKAKAYDMQLSLENRKHIERAKGILMRKLSLDEQGAYQHLQKLARDSRKQMSEVALSIIIAEQVFS